LTFPHQTALANDFFTPALLVITLIGFISKAVVIFCSANETFAGNSIFFVGTARSKQALSSLNPLHKKPLSPQFLDGAGRVMCEPGKTEC
jgi:hypothetical protein